MSTRPTSLCPESRRWASPYPPDLNMKIRMEQETHQRSLVDCVEVLHESFRVEYRWMFDGVWGDPSSIQVITKTWASMTKQIEMKYRHEIWSLEIKRTEWKTDRDRMKDRASCLLTCHWSLHLGSRMGRLWRCTLPSIALPFHCYSSESPRHLKRKETHMK